MIKNFETRKRWWLHSTVSTLTATELYTLKWLIVLYGFHLNRIFFKKENYHLFHFHIFVRMFTSTSVPFQRGSSFAFCLNDSFQALGLSIVAI